MIHLPIPLKEQGYLICTEYDRDQIIIVLKWTVILNFEYPDYNSSLNIALNFFHASIATVAFIFTVRTIFMTHFEP